MIQAKFKVDYSLFEEKMGAMGTKVIPYARVQAQQIAKYGQRMIKIFTLRGGTRTKGRKKIADLWDLQMQRKAYTDIYTIRNLYPKQDVVAIFEDGAMVHNIVPRKKKILYWEDPESGEGIYAMNVHHPGVPASHMMEKTRKALDPRIELWMRATFAMVDTVTRK